MQMLLAPASKLILFTMETSTFGGRFEFDVFGSVATHYSHAHLEKKQETYGQNVIRWQSDEYFINHSLAMPIKA